MPPMHKGDKANSVLQWFRNGCIVGVAISLLALFKEDGLLMREWAWTELTVMNIMTALSTVAFSGIIGAISAVVANRWSGSGGHSKP